MKKPIFREQYDKIVSAYLKDTLNPYDGCACFIGNLLNNENTWEYARHLITPKFTDAPCYSKDLKCIINPDKNILSIGTNFIKYISRGFYTIDNILKLEENFLRKYNDGRNEDSLYEAMASTLEILRKIHEEKGEIVKDYVFNKRVLETENG